MRRKMLDGLNKLNEMNYNSVGDLETQTRIAQYEMAFRMQTSVPELTDLSKETDTTWKLYGEEAKKPGTFANHALMARRLVERGVRFVQIYLNNWDHHGNLTGRMPSQCKDIDQATFGLINDLKARGLFDETLDHLGRRIWPHDLLAGRFKQDQLRTRPSSALLFDVDGWRRRQRRHRLRRNRRFFV